MKLTKDTKNKLVSLLQFDILTDEHPALGIIPHAFYEDYHESLFIQKYISNYYTRANYIEVLSLLGFSKGVSSVTCMDATTRHHEYYIAVDVKHVSEKTANQIIYIIDQINKADYNCLRRDLARELLTNNVVNYLELNHLFFDLENKQNISNMVDYLLQENVCSYKNMNMDMDHPIDETLMEQFGAILQ